MACEGCQLWKPDITGQVGYCPELQLVTVAGLSCDEHFVPKDD